MNNTIPTIANHNNALTANPTTTNTNQITSIPMIKPITKTAFR